METASRQAFLEMCADAPVEEFAAGTILMSEGEHGDFCFVIITGMVSIQVISGPKEREIARRGSGELIGEMSLFNKTRIATVRALEHCACVRLHHSAVLQMLTNKPSMAMALLAASMEKSRECVPYLN